MYALVRYTWDCGEVVEGSRKIITEYPDMVDVSTCKWHARCSNWRAAANEAPYFYQIENLTTGEKIDHSLPPGYTVVSDYE